MTMSVNTESGKGQLRWRVYIRIKEQKTLRGYFNNLQNRAICNSTVLLLNLIPRKGREGKRESRHIFHISGKY